MQNRVMKISLIISAVLAAFGIWALSSQSAAISSLEQEHKNVEQQLSERGLNFGSDLPETRAVARRSQATGNEVDVAQYVDELIEMMRSSEKMADMTPTERAEEEKRSYALLGKLSGLSPNNLIKLIDLLEADAALKDEMKDQSVVMILMLVSDTNPAASLEVIAHRIEEAGEIKDNDWTFNFTMQNALAKLSTQDPEAAATWLKGFYKRNEEIIDENQISQLIEGIGGADLDLALKIRDDLGLDEPSISDMSYQITRKAVTPEQKLELLKLGRSGEKYRELVNPLLNSISELSLSDAQAFVEKADLEDDELNTIVANGLRPDNGDVGEYLIWRYGLAGASEVSRNNGVTNTIRHWTQEDFRSAGEWVNSLQPGNLRDQAIAAYAETVLPYDRDASARWVEELPPGDLRRKIEKQLKETAVEEADD